MNFEQQKNTVERPFKGGDSLFGYDQVVELDGEIIGLKGEKVKELSKGMEVMTSEKGKPRVSGNIEGFVEPFENGSSDNIVIVSVNGEKRKLKPSEILL